MNKNLYTTIVNYKQTKDKNTLLLLLNDFKPLLKKYSFKLNYEDSMNDLICSFISIINKIHIDSSKFNGDKYVLSYINTAVINSYIYLSKKNTKISTNEYLIDTTDSSYEVNLTPSNLDTSTLIFEDIICNLTEYEKNILRSLFLYDMTVNEIALLYNKSRQAINQGKKRSLDKLKLAL